MVDSQALERLHKIVAYIEEYAPMGTTIRVLSDTPESLMVALEFRLPQDAHKGA